ncbi:MAG: DegT/DnrJ/EryC1/StrS family aminotransferase [Treponema sp.]
MSDADALKVKFFVPSISEDEENAVLEVLRSGWLTTGKSAAAFEANFSAFMNGGDDENAAAARKRAGLSTDFVQSLAVNSNTSGVLLAMEACGVTAGSAVITTPYTFVSTASCARHLGADVLFADTEKDSYSIDAAKVETLLKNDTARRIKAVLPVHIAGNVCDMEKLCALGKKYNVKIIEDAAHSFPSRTDLGYAGAIGDVGVFSFYVTKAITTGEGGMVCTRDKALASRMTTMRLHGMDRTTWDRYTSPRASWEYDIVEAGYKFNLPDVLAALGVCQLKKANDFLHKRVKIVKMYNEAFSHLDFITLPPDGKGNAWHLYLMRLKLDSLTIDRDEFAKRLQQKGIGVSVHFIPLFYFTYWKNLYKDFTKENFPNADALYKATISLPLWPDMTENDANLVINAVKEIGSECHV